MITSSPDGSVVFRAFVPDARDVRLAGDFTGWQADPIPMENIGAGWWTACLRLPPGEHRFKYIADQTRWIADYAAMGLEPDGFGGHNSRLVVEAKPAKKPRLTRAAGRAAETGERPAPRPRAVRRATTEADQSVA